MMAVKCGGHDQTDYLHIQFYPSTI